MCPPSPPPASPQSISLIPPPPLSRPYIATTDLTFDAGSPDQLQNRSQEAWDFCCSPGLCLPLRARQGSLSSRSPRFSAALHNRLLLVASPVCSLQSSLWHGITGIELHRWNCHHHIHGVSMLRLLHTPVTVHG